MGTGTVELGGAGALDTPAVQPVPVRVGYEPALDGLRAIAVFAVLVYHERGPATDKLGRGGFLGVDVFFVLSGYLITTLLLRERESNGRIALPRFWARRARRLLPALLLMLGAVVVYAHVVATAASSIRSAVVPTLLYYENWHAISSSAALESHAWSLAIEEQWYLVWPIVLAVVLIRVRRPLWRLLGVVTVLIAASAVWTAHLYGPFDPRAYFRTDTRGQSLLVGAALAILLALRERPSRPRAARAVQVGGSLGLGMLVWAFATWHNGARYVFTGGFLLVALASSALILAATQPGDGGLHRVLRWRPLVGLGLISYGVYLFDPVVVAVCNPQRTHVDGVPLFVLRFVITIVVAFASWRWVEQPIRRAPPGRAWPWVVIALGVVCVLVGAATIHVPARAAAQEPPLDNQLFAYLQPYRDLVDATPAGTHRLLVVGGDTASSVDATARPYRGSRVLCIVAAAPKCGLTSALSRSPDPVHHPNGCGFAPGLLESVAQAFRPTTVVVMIEPADLVNREVGGRTVSVGAAAWTSDATAQLDGFRRRLPPSVQHLWIVGGCGPTSPGLGALAVVRADRVWAAYARAHASDVGSVSVPPSVCANSDASRSMWPWIARLTA